MSFPRTRRTTPTKMEAQLAARQSSFDATMRLLASSPKSTKGMNKPGSLKKKGK